MSSITFKQFANYGLSKVGAFSKFFGMVVAFLFIPALVAFLLYHPFGYDYTINTVKQVEYEGQMCDVYYVTGEPVGLTASIRGEKPIEERYIRVTRGEDGKLHHWVSLPDLDTYT